MIAVTFMATLCAGVAAPQPESEDPRAPAPQPAMVAPEAEGAASGPNRAATASEVEATRGSATSARVKEKDGRKKKKASVRVGVRVMGGWQYQTERYQDSDPADGAAVEPTATKQQQEFFLRQARINLKARYTDHLRATISGDLADAVFSQDYQQPLFLRSAFGNIRIVDAFQIKLGRFKRPMSRLELRSVAKIPFRGRGLTNSWLVERAHWGDRALGAMMWGKSKNPRLRWALAATSPDWVPTKGAARGQFDGVDVLARLRYDPLKALSFGINGGYKKSEHADGTGANVWAAGGDARLRIKGLYVVSEILAAKDTYKQDSSSLEYNDPLGLGVVSYVNYDIELPGKFVLQPVALFEWSDTDMRFARTEAVRVLGGVNLLWDKYLRVMPQVDIVRPLYEIGDTPISDSVLTTWEPGETYFIMLSFQMP